MQLKHKRSNNIVVSGLAISKMASDADQFRELCESELNAYPRVCSAVRLGAPTVGRIQPLLVCLESPEEVEKIMLVARDLRNSSNWFVRDRIFINRHLTKAEAAAAFQAREQRRLKERSNRQRLGSFASHVNDCRCSYVAQLGLEPIHRRCTVLFECCPSYTSSSISSTSSSFRLIVTTVGVHNCAPGCLVQLSES